MSKKNTKRLIIVDVSNFIFRAFFAIRPLTAPDGTPVNAVQGVLSMLLKLMSKYRPTHLFLARDSKGGSFRNELYDQYKANRSEPPEDLVPQFGLIATMIDKMGLPNLVLDEYEADDIIGSAAVQFSKDFDEILIASGDKDLMQFVDGKVKMLDTMKDKNYGPDGVFEKMGVRPDQIVDYLSMVGDASDNIPGMRGIGAKGAAKLLGEYDTLEACIENKEKFTNKRVANAFENHVEDAMMSKKLVQIVTDLDLEATADDLEFRFYPSTELIRFLEELGFKAAVKKMNDIKFLETLGTSPADFQVVTEEVAPEFEVKWTAKSADITKLLKEINQLPQIGVYAQVQGVRREVVSLSISLGGETVYYLPLFHETMGDLVSGQVENISAADRKKIFKEIFAREDIEVVTSTLKDIYKVALSDGIESCCQFFDLVQADFVIDPSRKHDLDFLAERYDSHNLSAFDHVKQNFHELPAATAKEIAGERAWVLINISDKIKEELDKVDDQKVYYDLDLKVQPILAKMEWLGIRLNSDYIIDMAEDFQKELDSIQKSIEKITGTSINLKSPKQVGGLLFDELKLPIIKKTKTGYSTDSEVLEELKSMGESEVPALILKYRELDKLLSTYVTVLPRLVNPKTGRIHTQFHQHVAATGRLSSDHPNLQNIPIRTENGRLIRKGFVAEPGKILLACDYSQVELRILAHMSEDPTMISAFKENIDIHARTASEVLSIDLKDVSSNDRSKAKAVNFGLMYGQSSFGLSKALRISRKEARDYITMYFERFASVKGYLDLLKEKCEEKGYSETLFGRKRYLPDIRSENRTIKAQAERVAVNSPMQGTAADIIKKAMINIDAKLKEQKLKSKMLLQVHDELIFEVEEDELDIMKKLVKSEMESAFTLKIPLKVDMGIGVNWYDLK